MVRDLGILLAYWKVLRKLVVFNPACSLPTVNKIHQLFKRDPNYLWKPSQWTSASSFEPISRYTKTFSIRDECSPSLSVAFIHKNGLNHRMLSSGDRLLDLGDIAEQ